MTIAAFECLLRAFLLQNSFEMPYSKSWLIDYALCGTFLSRFAADLNTVQTEIEALHNLLLLYSFNYALHNAYISWFFFTFFKSNKRRYQLHYQKHLHAKYWRYKLLFSIFSVSRTFLVEMSKTYLLS